MEYAIRFERSELKDEPYLTSIVFTNLAEAQRALVFMKDHFPNRKPSIVTITKEEENDRT